MKKEPLLGMLSHLSFGGSLCHLEVVLLYTVNKKVSQFTGSMRLLVSISAKG